ncbi:MAG: hypothetical protein IMW90_21415 [Thermogemmatispora sp.]|uniref:hypothetical protein n=1 Tax=Thermogemmatispora sp. TaxID=1968838 RepID=UPI0019F015CA|nr:hypothetical protein [Thermogemmatispora sp.]MBE3568285.1 hypothetical protein [Thermogemmatispora sp.]
MTLRSSLTTSAGLYDENDPQMHTLSAQIATLASGTLTISGAAVNGAPSTPLLDGVQGNSGQFSYSYPSSVVAGPPGTTPALVYYCESTNERRLIAICH